MRLVGLVVVALLAAVPAAAGATFSDPEAIGQGGFQTSVTAATDAAGTTTAVLIGVPGGPSLTERTGGGAWSTAAPLGAAVGPLVAAAGEGALAVAWRVDRPRRYAGIGVRVRDPGRTLDETPTVFGAREGGVRYPAVAVGPGGDALLAYSSGVRHTIHARRGGIAVAWRAAGGAFTAPQIVDPTPSEPPVAALAADGTGIVAWRHGRRILALSIDVRAGRRGRVASFRAPDRVRGLSAAAGPGGAATLAWAGTRPLDRRRQHSVDEVRVLRRSAGRAFGRVQVVSRTPEDIIPSVALTADARGLTTLAWSEEHFGHDRSIGLRGITSAVRAATAAPGGRFGAAGTLAPRGAAGTLAPRADAYCAVPAVAAAAGRAALAWACLTHDGVVTLRAAVGRPGEATAVRTLSTTTLRTGATIASVATDVGLDDGGQATVVFTAPDPAAPATATVIRVLATSGNRPATPRPRGGAR